MFHNLKKDKGSYLSFGIIILFTAFMLNLAMVLSLQVDKAYDAKFETLHGANINVCIPKVQDTEQLAEKIEAIDGVKEVEQKEAILSEAVVKEFREADFDMRTVFYNMDDINAGKINQLEIKEESQTASEQPIYLPLYVSSFGEFQLDEKITYEVEGEKYTFSVAGVVEEMQYGNYGKGLMGAYLPSNVYDEFAKKNEKNTVIEYSLITSEKADIKKIENGLGELLSDQGIMVLSNCDSSSTKDTRTMVCNLLILILAAFALVILLVSVFLCKFRIHNSIEEEMVNMGVLKAMGYTGNMIVGSMVMPYVIVTMLTAFVGILASYGILPMLSQVLTLQSGFSFELSFDLIGLIVVEVLLIFIVVIFTYGAAKSIKKVQPIDAIRGNSGEKRIKKNHLPLEQTGGNIQLLLVLKQMLVCGRQNVLLFLVSFVLTILVAFASTLFYNVIVEPDNFMSTLSEEMPEAIFYPANACQETLTEVLQGNSEVKNVLQYTTGMVKIEDTSVTAFACENFSEVTNDLCYMGENPKTKNQVALGSAFEETYQIGDTIEIQNGDKSCNYEITGFVQSVNYQGNICELTMDGYESLNKESIIKSLYVYLEEGKEAEVLIEEFEKNHSDLIQKAMNTQEMEKKSQEMFSGITMVLIAVIFVLTMLIVLFILYIVIKSLLVQRKQELGIYKAIGYSNWQLMLQMAGSFLPVSITAILISSGLALVYMPYINQIIFQTVGAMKNNMEVSLGFLMIFAVIQIVMNFEISIYLTMPIKKISAYTLIKE